MTIYYILLALIKLKDSNITLVYMRIKSSNKIKLDSILSAQNVKCKVTKGRQILSGHPNLTFATTLLVKYMYIIWREGGSDSFMASLV